VGEGVVLAVGVWVMVGVAVIVVVVVPVGVWEGVTEPVGGGRVKVVVSVGVANTTGVKDGISVGVTPGCPFMPGAKSAATSPAQ
jgi:hypothetical protein